MWIRILVASGSLAGASAAPIFNGKDLTGLYTWLVDTRYEDPRQVFSATNGWLRISGDGLGYLATEKEYTNFVLTAEFKWGGRNFHWGNRIGRARDSGIFLHSRGPDGNSHDGRGAFRAAVECNIFQGATGDLLLIRGTNIAPAFAAEIAPGRDADGWPFWEQGGTRTNLVRWGRLNWSDKSRVWRDELDFRSPGDVEKPAGEWNRVECRSDRGRLQIRLNGALVNEAFDLQPYGGKILFQCEGSEIFFRKIDLKEL